MRNLRLKYPLLVLPVLVAGGVAGWLLLAGSPVDSSSGDSPSDAVPIPRVRFKDITKAAGVDFVHTNGAFGKKLLPETMGPGVAFLDYDNDGWQDILFINSCYWPGHEDKQKPKPTLVLYRNKGDGTFEDVTKA